MAALVDIIPGLAEAIDRERFVRDQSFLDLPEKLCGVEVQPLTLRRMLLLSAIDSPFLAGGKVSPYDIGAFFLTLHPCSGITRWRLLGRVGRLNQAEAIAAISALLDETFQDSPAQSGKEEASYYSFAAGLVDCFASEYGWTEAETLDVPIKRLFQYLKAITKRNNPKAIMFNPSDKVKGRWLQEQNQLSN